MRNETKYDLSNLAYWMGGAGVLGIFTGIMISGLLGAKIADVTTIVMAQVLVVSSILFIIMMIGWIGSIVYGNRRLEVEER